MEVKYGDKVYIGKVEAFEILQEHNYFEGLPRKGYQVMNVPAIATGIPCSVIGKDEQGFYYAEVLN